MGERITLTASDGFMLNGYRARPEGTPRGAVVLIHEVWGLNHWIRSVVDRWARHGYLTIAPAMFDRVEFGYESENYGPDQFTIIGEMMKQFDQGKALLDVEAAIKAASEGGQVGITGYCFGGRITWVAAHHGMGLTAASGYYGRRAQLYRPQAGRPARDALWGPRYRHPARADRAVEGAASGGGHLRLPGRPWLL